MAAVRWDECLAELLHQLADRGLVAVVKADGERSRGRWTVLVSGPPLDEAVRWDGDDLGDGLAKVVAQMQEQISGVLDGS